LNKATKSGACGEHKEFKNGTDTVHVAGFLQCLSKHLLVDISMLEHNERLLNKKMGSVSFLKKEVEGFQA